MAESKKVTGNDVIQKDFLKNAIDNAEKFKGVVIQTIDSIKILNAETAKQLVQAKKGETSADLKKQNDLLTKSAQQRKLIAEAKKLEAEATVAVTKATKALEDAEKRKNAETAKNLKILDQQNSAYLQASKKLKELQAQYKDLAISGKGADKSTQDLLKTIKELDKQLKEVDADIGIFNRNVGDYKNQVGDAIKETDLFSAGLGKLDNNTKAIVAGFGAVIEQLKKVRQAEDAASDGANKFGKTLKAAGITLLIAAIASLFSFFNSSREGALQFDLILNKLKATLDVLIGSFAQVGKGLVALGSAFVSFFKGDFSEAADKAVEGTDSIKNAFDGNFNAISEQIKGYDELTKAIFAYEDQLRLLQVALAKVKMDEEDYNEIQADNTISLNEQKAALEGAIEARLEAEKISKQIADTELTLAGKQLELELRKNKVSEADIELLRQQGFESISASKLSVKASNETINAIQEKYLAQLAAADALDDLDRQEAERRRQIAQTEIINEVELIRSKKLGADAQVQILTKQVADEKIQLEERRKINDELRAKEIEAQNEEIKALARLKTSKGEQAISEEELFDLINTHDAVLLANKLKALRADKLSEEASTEVAKVVLEAQNKQIANDERIAKFNEEELLRLQKIARLNKEIQIIKDNTTLDAISETAAEKVTNAQQANDLIFQAQNAFDRNIISAAQKASDEKRAILQQEYDFRKKLLDEQYEIDKQATIDSVNDKQLQAKELEKLQVQYQQNINKINIAASKTQKQLDDEDIERKRKIAIQQTQIIVNSLQKASSAISAELDQRFDNQNQRQQDQIEKTNAAIAKQQDLAQRGQANELAFQEEQLAKQQLAAQDAAKRQARIKDEIQTAEALLNAYNSELTQPNANPGTAAAKAIADVLAFKGLAKGIVQFAVDGNENVQPVGGQYAPKGKDTIPFLLAPEEGVVTAKGNMENKGVVKALNDGTFKQLYTPRVPTAGDTGKNIMTSLMMQSNAKLESLVQELIKETKNKPTQMISANALGEIVETIQENGIKKIITHKKKKPRLG